MAFINQTEVYESGKDENGNPILNVALDNRIVDALAGARRCSADLSSHLSFLEEALVDTSRELAKERKVNQQIQSVFEQEVTKAHQRIQALEDQMREYEMIVETLENKLPSEVPPHAEPDVAPAECSPDAEGKPTPVDEADLITG
jgi:hypothetical protein|nr:MAG TPA: Protein of unknown function (DUF1664) [Bacteriophage sp.]